MVYTRNIFSYPSNEAWLLHIDVDLAVVSAFVSLAVSTTEMLLLLLLLHILLVKLLLQLLMLLVIEVLSNRLLLVLFENIPRL